MFINARSASRFVGMSPGEFVVVGLSFKRERDNGLRSEFGNNSDLNFKIGDIEKPLDIVSALQITEQRIIN